MKQFVFTAALTACSSFEGGSIVLVEGDSVEAEGGSVEGGSAVEGDSNGRVATTGSTKGTCTNFKRYVLRSSRNCLEACRRGSGGFFLDFHWR